MGSMPVVELVLTISPASMPMPRTRSVSASQDWRDGQMGAGT